MLQPVAAKRRGRRPLTPRFVEAEELAAYYAQFFETLAAQDGALHKAALHLRYRNLCEDRQILPAADYPEQMEYDMYDAQARHAVLSYRADNRLIGNVRLILPCAERPLPSCMLSPQLAAEMPPTTAEVSRFLIAKEFLRRWNDGDYGTVSPWLSGDNQRRIPHSSLGLLRFVLQQARLAGMTHLVALAEPALLRLLNGLGLHFAPVGNLVAHHGMRQPCYAKLDSLLRRLKQERPEIWHFLTENGRWA